MSPQSVRRTRRPALSCHPVIIFPGLRSESADLETLRPNTRLVEKPYPLVMLLDTLEDMIEESKGNQSGLGRIAAS